MRIVHDEWSMALCGEDVVEVGKVGIFPTSLTYRFWSNLVILVHVLQ